MTRNRHLLSTLILSLGLLLSVWGSLGLGVGLPGARAAVPVREPRPSARCLPAKTNCQPPEATTAKTRVKALPLFQATITTSLRPSRDNTLYESTTGSLSNGRGQHFFAGRTGQSTGSIRRGLIAFDLANSNIPAGVTIVSARLKLHMSRTVAGPQTVSIHRLLEDWGEGTSDASLLPGGEGGGTAATTNDATWLHRFFNTSTWSTPGGVFTPTASASASVNNIGFYQWGSTSQMVTDVQSWLNEPATNFGWLLQGNESTPLTTKRFDSRENPIMANQPELIVEYIPPPPELVVTKSVDNTDPPAGGQITYTITIANIGVTTATNILVSDTIPAGVNFVGPLVLTPPGTTQPSPAFPVLTSGLTISAGQSITLTFPVTVDTSLSPGTRITNTASVTSAEGSAPANGSVAFRIIDPAADLVIDKMVDDPTPQAGDQINYDIVVSNIGLSDATGVVVSDTLSSGLNFVGPVTLTPPGITLPPPAFPVLTSGLTISAGQSITLAFPVTVDTSLGPGTPITNTASVTSTQTPTPTTGSAVATVASPGIALTLRKLVSSSTPHPGDLITYTIIIANNGLNTATNVAVSDTLPTELSLAGPVLLMPPGTMLPTPTLPILATGLTVSAGSKITLTFPVSLDLSLASGTQLTNVARAQTGLISPAFGSASFRVASGVFLPIIVKPGLPDLVGSFKLTPDKSSYNSTEPVQVTVVVTNQGSAPADAFWVDFYINPNPPPTGPNMIWSDLCGLSPCYGLAWFVSGGLASGASVTLTSNPGSFSDSHSIWPGHFASGSSDLYLFVDSWNPGVATGGVSEENEANNRSERHGLTVSGLNVTGEGLPVPFDLPRRPNP